LERHDDSPEPGIAAQARLRVLFGKALRRLRHPSRSKQLKSFIGS